jgi:exodeoxyribonuclease VII large subunit
MRRAVGQQLTQKHDRLSHLEQLITSLDPASVLKRGFSITTVDGNRITSSDGIRAGDSVVTHLYKGRIHSIVIAHE